MGSAGGWNAAQRAGRWDGSPPRSTAGQRRESAAVLVWRVVRCAAVRRRQGAVLPEAERPTRAG